MQREDFPLLQNNLDLCYLDNAATTQKPAAVINALSDYYCNSNANVHRGIYKLSEQATAAYETARATVADFIKANPQEISFNSGTTMGINLLSAYYFANKLTASDTILLTKMEHHSNIVPWQQLAKKTGSQLKFLNIKDDFTLDLQELQSILRNNHVAVFSLVHISNVLGTINPIKEIISMVNEISPMTVVVVDAAQSLAHLPLDVRALNCDFLVASGHKAYGPTGIGFLYAKQELLVQAEPFFTGGGMIETVTENLTTYTSLPERNEAGTPNIAGAIGFASALNYIKQIGFEKIIAHEQALTKQLVAGLKAIPEIKLYHCQQSGFSCGAGVVSFTIDKIHAHDLAQILDTSNIAVRAGHHCTQILHRDVLKITASTRASIALYNTSEDVEKLITAIKTAVGAGLFR